jgi:hypothetical protein
VFWWFSPLFRMLICIQLSFLRWIVVLLAYSSYSFIPGGSVGTLVFVCCYVWLATVLLWSFIFFHFPVVSERFSYVDALL